MNKQGNFSITLAQLNPIIGDIDHNFEKLKSFIKEKSAVSDLIVTSELFLCGYPPKDLLNYDDFFKKIEAGLQKLIALSKNYPALGILVGTPLKFGQNITNSACLIADGKIIFQQDKSLFPNYDVFNESRYFTSNRRPKAFKFKRQTLGIIICEDSWAHLGYDFDPVAYLIQERPDFIIHLSASPFDLHKFEERLEVHAGIAKKHAIPIISVNQVGGNDDLLFDGRSFVCDTGGNLVHKAAAYQEDNITISLPLEEKITTQYPQETQTEEIHNALIMGIRDFLQKCKIKRVILGLSGGIDSSVVAALAVKALGVEAVTGLIMPSIYSSKSSITDAEELCNMLKINAYVLPIQTLFGPYKELLSPIFKGMPEDITEENLQARIRGTLLMSYANKFNAMLLATGNKSELATGYCTLYGDMCGGLAPLGDIYKTQVYKLASYLNSLEACIPENSITKPPSAELKENQTDQDYLPAYEVLDGVLKSLMEEKNSLHELYEKYDKKIVEWVVQKVSSQEYKRFQVAPILRVTRNTFGLGRIMPIVKNFVA